MIYDSIVKRDCKESVFIRIIKSILLMQFDLIT
jgi:hypothetical protein